MGKATAVWCIDYLGRFGFRRWRRGIVVFSIGGLVEETASWEICYYWTFIGFMKYYSAAVCRTLRLRPFGYV
jgi:hypothetical protein